MLAAPCTCIRTAILIHVQRVSSVDGSYTSLNAVSAFVLQLAIIFIDMEGSPVQELSAIHMNAHTKQIVDVYHTHAFSHRSDLWARTQFSK